MHRLLLLLQAISAKFCHDMAGPIGTVDNGLSLLNAKNEEIATKSKELAIRESVNLVSKIKFYRAAYGISEGEDKFSIIKLFSLAHDFFDRGKVKFVPQAESGVIYIDALIAKSILCLLMIVAESNIYGGEMYLTIPADDQLEPIIIKSSGKKIVMREERVCILENFQQNYPINPVNCREHYVKELCASKKYHLAVQQSNDTVEIKLFRKKSD